MTEEEWLAAGDPGPMLDFLRGKATDRKLRLLAVACCRRVWHLLPQQTQQPVAMTERCADGQARLEEVEAYLAGHNAYPPRGDGWDRVEAQGGWLPEALILPDAVRAGRMTAARMRHLKGGEAATEARRRRPRVEAGELEKWQAAWDQVCELVESAATTEGDGQASVLHDLFGPLHFRPMTIDPWVLAWNDRLVVRLAQAIYDERRWSDMPILGDALLDAGCGDEEMLAHCRADGEHVRGCWVLDLLLAKE